MAQLETDIAEARELAWKHNGNAKAFFAELKQGTTIAKLITADFSTYKVTGIMPKREFSSEIVKLIVEGATLAPVAPTPAAIGEQVLQLATHPSEKVSRPIVRGIEKAIAAHEKLMSHEAFSALSPSEKKNYCLAGGKLSSLASTPMSAMLTAQGERRADITPEAVAAKKQASESLARSLVWCGAGLRHWIMREMTISDSNRVGNACYLAWDKARKAFATQCAGTWPEAIHQSPKLETE